MKRIVSNLAGTLAVLLLLSCTAAFGKAGFGDKRFLSAAYQGNLEEVALGKLAQQKASNPQIKDAGKRMVTDHSKMEDQVKMVAQKEQVSLPAGMSQMQQRDIDKLTKLSGADFDKQYTQMMVKDHQSDVKDFQKEEKGTKDAGIKKLVAGALPTIEAHLTMFQSVQNGKGSTKNTKMPMK
ncbi:MAG TPA: DUF4142 domain-containing protein [Candidatus Xenobia bacterium]|jgi:putative membrane protein